jgi:hypothetical protein
MVYNRRDLIGHWVRKTQPQRQPCTHACCRGYRVHPDNYPVVPPNRLLRRASDEDLATHYENTNSREAKDQVLYEMDRRDRAEEQRAERRRTYERLRLARRIERDEAVEYSYVRAENETRGHMLNKAGRAADIDPRSLFTGPESRARRYASEELVNHWADNPRPTAAMMEGRDTRVHVQYSAPRARRPARVRRAA